MTSTIIAFVNLPFRQEVTAIQLLDISRHLYDTAKEVAKLRLTNACLVATIS